MQTILITGASSGFGKCCADYLANRGHRVYGTSRRASFADAAAESPSLTMIPLDVRDQQSIDGALDFIRRREASLDVVINNAGYGIAGALEDTTTEEAQALFDTNFFGVHRLCRQASAMMRAQGRGRIINIGSLGGAVAIPYQVFYSASKAALQRYSQGLSMELAPFNIEVTHIEPGDFNTGFTSAREFVAADNHSSPFHQRCRSAVAVMEQDERHGADPLLLAKLIERIVDGRASRPRYRTGMITQLILVKLLRVFPESTINRVISNIYS